MNVGSGRLRLRDEAAAAGQQATDQSGVTAAPGSKDNASVASSDDMSRSLDHRHKVRLYVERAGLWNPADASLRVLVSIGGQGLLRIIVRPGGRLRIHGAIDDSAGNRKGDYRTGTAGTLD